MRKQSYIKLKHIYNVPLLTLRTYSRRCGEGPDLRLLKRSYEELMHLFQMKRELFPAPSVYAIANDGSRDLRSSPSPVRQGARPLPPQGFPDHLGASEIEPLSVRLPWVRIQNSYNEPSPTELPPHNQQTRLPQYTQLSASNYSAYHSYSAIPDSLYRSYRYSPPAPPRDSTDDPKDCSDGDMQVFKYVVGCVAVGTFIWWCYRRK
jgi:hypothetical protein